MTLHDLTHLTQTRALPDPYVSAFTDAMSALASGVVMVTNWIDGRPWGMTVSAFTSVSADPPTILVSLGSETASARAIAGAGTFGVSILGRHHRAAARHGSSPGTSKHLDRFVDWRGDQPTPAIGGALAHLECVVEASIPVADHTIVVGRVLDVAVGDGGEPLVYFRRAYRTLARFTVPSTSRTTPCPSS
jgi:flavin reductase (DIM6/NTAB) family NADH-FMN oxidoreductase RutF